MRNMSKILYSLLAVLFFTTGLSAQQTAVSQGQTIPFDAKTIKGQLDNGLTYYVRANSHPENRAEFYLVVNAGAVQEDADQNGLAHFCEHMAFNGTEHFAKHDLIYYLQSIGMKFGPEINAFTSHDVTAYMLQKVPTDTPENIDTALLVLHDWANRVAFENEEIDNERGVIHEEWRSRRSAQFRMSTRTNPVLFQGSKYAKHDVIGDIDIIDNFEYDVIKRFYHDWYRPNLEAIIAVGDFDEKEIEQKIQKLFGGLEGPEQERERVYHSLPAHEETLVAIETDPEAQYPIVQVYYKHPAPAQKDYAYYRNSIAEQLYNTMMNARLNELLQSENPPFVYAYSAYTNLVKMNDAYISFAVAKNNETPVALRAILKENVRVQKFGFTGTELERAKMEVLRGVEKAYDERNKKGSDKYVWEYFQNFLTQEPVPGIEFDLDFVKNILPEISLEEINQLPAQWISDKSRVVLITGPEKEGVNYPSQEEVLNILNEVEQDEVTAYVDKVVDAPLVANIPLPSKVEKVKKDKVFETETWTLANGVKVVVKPTEFQDDEVLLSAYSKGGSSLCRDRDRYSAEMAAGLVRESGVGQFDKSALRKKLAGKQVSLYPYLSENEEGFRGNASPKDLETLLQLVYLYYTQPRFEEKAFNSQMEQYRLSLENKALNPKAAFYDTINTVMSCNHPRRKPWVVEDLEKAKLKKMEYVYRERFGDPSNFTFFLVGNLNLETLKPMVETYLGGLPKVEREESWKDLGIRSPKGVVEKHFNRPMETPKSSVYINFTGDCEYSGENKLLLTAIQDILSVRYTETVREEQGGTYGVWVRSQLDAIPTPEYALAMGFECDPERATELSKIIYAEIEKLKQEGPQEKDFNGFIENQLKSLEESKEENNFWLKTLKQYDFYQLKSKQLSKAEKRINKLTPKMIQQAAIEFVNMENHVEVIMGPEK